MRCSRHAGTVAALHGKAVTFASARPPCRRPLAVFSDRISVVRSNRQSRQTQSSAKLNTTEADRGGVFFERKRRKKSHRMGRPKRVFSLTQLFTPCRDSRRSPWQSHDVRVGPPAMSSSIRSLSPAAFLQLSMNELRSNALRQLRQYRRVLQSGHILRNSFAFGNRAQ